MYGKKAREKIFRFFSRSQFSEVKHGVLQVKGRMRKILYLYDGGGNLICWVACFLERDRNGRIAKYLSFYNQIKENENLIVEVGGWMQDM